MRRFLTALSRLFTGRRENQSNSPQASSGGRLNVWESKLVWMEAGDAGNPFPYRVLDCRAVALGLTSTTSDPAIATRFVALRADDGRSHFGSMPANPFSFDCDLHFPYNGQRDEGVIHSAREMEDKWDFYVYDSRLYISRSWTGMLMHVAELKYTETEVVITAVHSSRDMVPGDPDYGRAQIRFLILARLGRQRLAFPISPGTNPNDCRTIALLGFGSYGRKAEFAAALTDLMLSQ